MIKGAVVPVLSLRGISHSFGSVAALSGVDLEVRPGEVHALIGENGAGKTTLVRIAAGQIRPDAGEIRLEDQPIQLHSRAHSAAMGIGVAHQHLSLVPQFTVAENMLLGHPAGEVVLDLPQARKDVARWVEHLGLDIDPDARVGGLQLGIRQQVEILTALAWGARVLLLDEPTATLSQVDALAVLDTVLGLRDEGVGVLLISHKMREVAAVADRISVLRGGRLVAEHAASSASEERLAKEMIGDGHTLEMMDKRQINPGGIRLEVDGVFGHGLNGLSLEVRAREVLGVAGVAGNGQEGLVLGIVGLAEFSSGRVYIDGNDVTGDPRAALAHGVGVVPEDRARDALAVSLPLWKNTMARSSQRAEFRLRGRIDRRSALEWCQRVLETMKVRPSRPALRLRSLSGGNQQRLLVGRELEHDPAVVVAAEPTRGLDPAGAVEVAEKIAATANEGTAVLLLSSELEELLTLSDRIVVLYRGQILDEFSADNVDMQRLGLAMAGVSDDN